MIPKNLHQVWVGNQNSQVPDRYAPHIKSMKDVSQDFNYFMWLDRDVDELLKETAYHKYADCYQRLPYPIMKADMARWLILHKHGGIYSDLDFMGLKNLSGLLEQFSDQELIITSESYDMGYENTCCNGFMACKPGLSIVLDLLDEIQSRCSKSMSGFNDVIILTGPAVVYDVFSLDERYETWMVDRRYILPEVKKEINPDMSHAYVTTIWEDGTGWSVGVIHDTARDAVCFYAGVALIGVVIALASGRMS